MLSLSASRHLVSIVIAASSLLGVACAGESAAPTYTPTDVDADAATAIAEPTEAACVTGETRACKISLGEHDGIANCVEGLDVCSGGEWTGCVDEASLAENPELLSQLAQ